MAEKQGRCTNFGNCSRAEAKEIISVPIGGDFVCPEPDCRQPLTPVASTNGRRNNRILWLTAGVLVVSIVIVGVLFFQRNPEEEFINQVKTILARTGGVFSTVEENEISTLASNLKLAGRADELTKKCKLEYILEKRNALQKSLNLHPGEEIPRNELQPICELARKMGMAEAIEGCSVPVDSIKTLLERGEFAEAKDLVKQAPNDPLAKKLCDQMETPLTLEADFQYILEGQATPSPIYAFGAEKLRGLILTNRDGYRLKVSVSQDDTFLYIFQTDQYQDLKRIFPDPVYSRGVGNPIRKGMPYSVSVPTEAEWLTLNELDTTKTGLITESIYVMASPWRAADLERLYGKIHETTDLDTRNNLMAEFLKQLRQRNAQNLKCADYKEFSFQHK